MFFFPLQRNVFDVEQREREEDVEQEGGEDLVQGRNWGSDVTLTNTIHVTWRWQIPFTWRHNFEQTSEMQDLWPNMCYVNAEREQIYW